MTKTANNGRNAHAGGRHVHKTEPKWRTLATDSGKFNLVETFTSINAVRDDLAQYSLAEKREIDYYVFEIETGELYYHKTKKDTVLGTRVKVTY